MSFDCPASLRDRLRARYDEPHRRYHTWEHVLACFDAVVRITDASMAEVELALLFHDAVYEPLASDNERRSAELLVEEGRRVWLDDRLLQRASRLVLATTHRASEAADTPEACVVLDADLSILGSDPRTFDRYERQAREEYARVDDAIYADGRRRILRSFLACPTIYSTPRGRNLWEARARENLERSVARLAIAVSPRTGPASAGPPRPASPASAPIAAAPGSSPRTASPAAPAPSPPPAGAPR
jgi:predicted metal-dependent HD superfamily phosphohydrolase